MKLANGIIDFLINVLTFYRDFFKKSFTAALIFSLASVVTACFLLLNAPSDFVAGFNKSGFILLIFRHTSASGTYNSIDLYKICYLLFVSFFAIGFIKTFYSGNFSFPAMMFRIKGKDVFYILLAGIVAGGIDLGIYFIMHSLSLKNAFGEWLWYFFYEVRIYVPLLVFSFAVAESLFAQEVKFQFKHLGLLLACAWLFYVFTYNFGILYDTLFASIILLPIPFGDTKFIIELLLTIPLLAFFVLGFTSVFTFPLGFYLLKQLNHTEGEGEENNNEQFED